MAAVLVFVVVAVLAWGLLPSPPSEGRAPGHGPVDGQYARFGEALRREVAAHGVTLEPVATAGSMENTQLPLRGEIDGSLVQRGNLTDAQAALLESVATVFYETKPVVQRADWPSNHIAIGAAGSGGHALVLELLADQGVLDGVPPKTELLVIGGEQAVAAHRRLRVDRLESLKKSVAGAQAP